MVRFRRRNASCSKLAARRDGSQTGEQPDRGRKKGRLAAVVRWQNHRGLARLQDGQNAAGMESDRRHPGSGERRRGWQRRRRRRRHHHRRAVRQLRSPTGMENRGPGRQQRPHREGVGRRRDVVAYRARNADSGQRGLSGPFRAGIGRGLLRPLRPVEGRVAPAGRVECGPCRGRRTPPRALAEWRETLRVRTGSDDWNQRVAKSKFKNMPHFKAPPTNGHICLQDYTARLESRNLKIRTPR